MADRFYKIALAVGGGLLAVSVVLGVLLHRAASAEQALSPGEDTFGVAVLGMIYFPAILATALGGTLSVFIGWSVLTFRRLRSPN